MHNNKSFYQSFDYDDKINMTLPYYEDFHKQAVDVVRAMNLSKVSWLDTGCGTGRMARKALEELNRTDIHFTLCDISKEMLNIAKKRLAMQILPIGIFRHKSWITMSSSIS